MTLRVEKRLNKEGQMVENEVIGYLIPEFVALTGMSDEQRSNYQTMKKLAPFTKLEPGERMSGAEKIKQMLNQSHELKIGDSKTIDAFQLTQPNIRLMANNVIKNHGDGSMKVQDRLRNSMHFKDWVVVYSYGKNSKYDDQDADDLVGIIKQASKAFGIKFDDPGFITCDSHINSWKEEIKKDFDKNGKPQIVVLYFNPFEEKFYG